MPVPTKTTAGRPAPCSLLPALLAQRAHCQPPGPPCFVQPLRPVLLCPTPQLSSSSSSLPAFIDSHHMPGGLFCMGITSSVSTTQKWLPWLSSLCWWGHQGTRKFNHLAGVTQPGAPKLLLSPLRKRHPRAPAPQARNASLVCLPSPPRIPQQRGLRALPLKCLSPAPSTASRLVPLERRPQHVHRPAWLALLSPSCLPFSSSPSLLVFPLPSFLSPFLPSILYSFFPSVLKYLFYYSSPLRPTNQVIAIKISWWHLPRGGGVSLSAGHRRRGGA